MPGSSRRHHSPLHIGPAERGDAEVLAEYNLLMAQETESKSLDPETVLAGVLGVFDDPGRGRYLVARKEHQIVGQLLVTLEWSDWRNGEIWWIQSVYVHPEHRGQGVFRELYRAISKEAESRKDVVGLRLYVEYENEAAKQVYESLGMRAGGYLVMESMK